MYGNIEAAGAARTYQDVISGRTFDRPGLKALLDYARAGDTLTVVRLDRLGRSLRELLEVVETLKARQIALVSLEEKIDTALRLIHSLQQQLDSIDSTLARALNR